MKYLVTLGYRNTYEFKDDMTALQFAELAYKCRVEKEDMYDVEVKIVGDDHEAD